MKNTRFSLGRQRRRRCQRRRTGRTLRVERLETRWLLHGGSVGENLVPEGEATPMPDFELVDLNTNSATYQHNVSPRDYLQQVTGWYFTYAT